MKRVGIIIPAYNAQDTIGDLLYSIASQTRRDDCQVIIVNDCDQLGYEKFITKFACLDIVVLTNEEHSGPGTARNTGMQYAIKKEIPYLMFCDADDILLSNLAVELLLSQIEHYDLVTSGFYEVLEGALIPHLDYDIWVFGKMYKSEIIEQHNIHFQNNSYANEDVGFNLWYWLCSDKKINIDEKLYLWQENIKSITRRDGRSYSYTSYVPLCQILKYTYSQVLKDKTIDQQKILASVSNRVIRLYAGFNELSMRVEPEEEPQKRIDALKNLYNECFKSLWKDIPQEFFLEAWNEINYTGISKIGFCDFIKKIREDD